MSLKLIWPEPHGTLLVLLKILMIVYFYGNLCSRAFLTTTLRKELWRSEIDPFLEKAWLRSENIFLLGDFNCHFSFQGDPDNILHRNTIKLRSIFESFNMHNMIQEATRSTISSRTLLDLFVTTKRDLISSSGVFPLGLSDHDLIYATIRLKNKRPSPKIIKTRNYKRMDVEKFKHDLERTPFHIASIFEEPDDQLWVWERLFDDISNEHAP